MREVTAHARALQKDIARRRRRVRRADAVLDVVVNPVAHRLHARVAGLEAAEHAHRRRAQAVRFAVARGHQVGQHVVRQGLDRQLLGAQIGRGAQQAHPCAVAQRQRPGGGLQAQRAVAVHRVGVHFVLDRRRQPQRLLHHLLVHAVERMHEEQEVRVVEQRVRQLAIDVEQARRRWAGRGHSILLQKHVSVPLSTAGASHAQRFCA
jgi:hypothetical protein